MVFKEWHLMKNILLTDSMNHVIRKISNNGQVTTFAGSGQSGSDDGSHEVSSFNMPWESIISANHFYVITMLTTLLDS